MENRRAQLDDTAHTRTRLSFWHTLQLLSSFYLSFSCAAAAAAATEGNTENV